MATYVNNLRLTELATGEGSGTWGTTTNTSLELIGEALGYNTQNCFSSDADATTTIADGATDPARAFYFKVTSSATLTATRTLTIAPNTISRVMFIENATTGSQSITISQGSGANVTIATGKTAVVYLDGAGSGAAVVDAMAKVDPGVTDTLAEVLAAGNTTGGTDISVSSGDDITFADSSKAIFGAGSDLKIYHDGTDNVFDSSTTFTFDGETEGKLIFKDSGTSYGRIDSNGAAGFDITSEIQDGDLRLRGNDGGSTINALTLDMSAAGAATFNSTIALGDNKQIFFGAGSDGRISFDGTNALNITASNGTATTLNLTANNFTIGGASALISGTANDSVVINEASGDVDFRVESDGASHMLFVDAGNNRVGIGESAPDTPLHLTTSSTGTAVTIESTGGNSASGPDLVLYRNSSSPLASDALASIKFRGEDSGGATNDYAQIISSIVDPTAGSEDGLMTLQTIVAGTNRNRLTVNSTELNINESGRSLDFRVESDSNANALFVDANVDRVAIGHNAPNALLDVYLSAEGDYLRAGGGAAGRQLKFTSGTSTGSSVGARHTIDAISGGGEIFFATGGTTHLTLSSSGNVGIGLGAFVSSTPLHVKSSLQGDNTVLIESDNGGAAHGPTVDLFRNSSSPAAGDDVGRISFTAEDSAGNKETYAFISATVHDPTNASEDGRFNLNTTVAGSSVSRMYMLPTVTTFNEAGGDIDFRVESNTNTHALYLDAGTSKIGINTSSPDFMLEVGDPNSGVAADIAISSGGTTEKRLVFKRSTIEDFVLVEDTSENLSLNAGLSGKEFVINNTSTDLDFRVESDNKTHMFFVDASNDGVGIGDGYTLANGLMIASTTSTTNAIDTKLNLRAYSSGTTTTGFGPGITFGGARNGDGVIQSMARINAVAEVNSGTTLSSGLSFETATAGVESEKMRIQNDGKIRLGNTSDHAMIDVTASNAAIQLIDNNQSNPPTIRGNGPNFTIENGGLEMMRVSGTSDIVFNEGSQDINFRIEGSNLASAFFVDAGEDQVGVGTTSVTTSFMFGVQGSTALGDRANNVSGGGYRTELSGLSITDGSGLYGSYGQLNFYANNSFTSSARRWVITNGLDANKLGFIVGDSAHNSQPEVDGTNGTVTNGIVALSFDNVGSAVFNEDSQDADFRVESNNQTHMLFVDAGNDRLLIGKTAADTGVVGTQFRPDGLIAVTRDSDVTGIFNRNTSDGNILTFRKDNTDVGALGTNGGDLFVGTGDTNLLFADGSNRIMPVTTGGATVDKTIDLGTNGGRFKDAYFRGVDITNDSDRGRIRLYANASLGGEMRIFNANGYGLISMISNHTLNFHTNSVERLELGEGEAVFNDVGNDVDFRVESDTNTHAIFVDASAARVGIGLGNPGAHLHVKGNNATDGASIKLQEANNNTSDTLGTIFFGNNSADELGRIIGFTSGTATTCTLRFMSTSNGGTAVNNLDLASSNVTFNENAADCDFRVESDNSSYGIYLDAANDRLLVGRGDVSTGEDFFAVDAKPGTTGHVVRTGRDDNSTKNHFVFMNPNGTVGSIQTTGSQTLFNTSSDARLKENIADANDAGELIDAIQVRQFDWIADGEHQRYGMVAQEIKTVAPEAVSEGETEDDMMAVDYSKLVPMLIKEIQSLRARVAQLESN